MRKYVRFIDWEIEIRNRWNHFVQFVDFGAGFFDGIRSVIPTSDRFSRGPDDINEVCGMEENMGSEVVGDSELSRELIIFVESDNKPTFERNH
jgi:hypothetical protein